jgi:putative ABC transport system ATP-binding protein
MIHDPSGNGSSMIRLRDVRKTYQTERIETLALNGIDLDIKSGEFVSIMGPSGSGKSTLLNVIGLLDEPSSGEVWIGSQRVDEHGDRALARLRNEAIGFVFQSFHLVPDLTVLDNVEIPLLYRVGDGDGASRGRHLSHRQRRQLATAAIERVGLGSRLHHFPTQLSGGQQQRVAIARAIVGRPRIVLADEPTGNLDSQTGEDVMDILEELRRDGTTVVMVTHDHRLAERTGRTVRLFDGRQVN